MDVAMALHLPGKVVKRLVISLLWHDVIYWITVSSYDNHYNYKIIWQAYQIKAKWRFVRYMPIFGRPEESLPVRILPFRLLPFCLWFVPFRLLPFRLLPFRLLWKFWLFPFRLLIIADKEIFFFFFFFYDYYSHSEIQCHNTSHKPKLNAPI